MSESSNVKIDPQYITQALDALLAEARQQNLMLTALVNQQRDQIRALEQALEQKESSVSTVD